MSHTPPIRLGPENYEGFFQLPPGNHRASFWKKELATHQAQLMVDKSGNAYLIYLPPDGSPQKHLEAIRGGRWVLGTNCGITVYK